MENLENMNEVVEEVDATLETPEEINEIITSEYQNKGE